MQKKKLPAMAKFSSPDKKSFKNKYPAANNINLARIFKRIFGTISFTGLAYLEKCL